jgi:ATP-dependent exoDNAse (exonuclease V) alpha subunit
MSISFTDDQNSALALFHNGACIFLSGSGGTGKTMIVKEMISRAGAEGRQVAVAASTGLAASLIPGGRTIHGLLQVYPKMDFNSVDFAEKIKYIENIDILFIDEVSMLGKRFIPYLYNCLEAADKKIQLIMIGDFFQLPPVNDDYAFKSPYWKLLRLEPCILHQVIRQKDEEMIRNLNRLKYGDPECIRYFMDHSSPSAFDDQITICAKNDSVKRINQMKLEQLKGTEYTYIAQSPEGPSDNDFPGENKLVIKEGARVMATVNDKDFINGSLGTITNLQCDSIDVLFDSGKEVRLYRHSFESNKVDRYGRRAVVFQFPIRLAYAITIHKSQGQSFDYVNIDGASCFAPGQLYVAVSRAKSIEHIHFTSPITKDSIISDASVKQFYRNIEMKAFIPGTKKAVGF